MCLQWKFSSCTLVLLFTVLAPSAAFVPVRSLVGSELEGDDGASAHGGPTPVVDSAREIPGLYNYHRLQLRRAGLGHLWPGEQDGESEQKEPISQRYPELSSESNLVHAPYDRLPHRYDGLPASWCAVLGDDKKCKNRTEVPEEEKSGPKGKDESSNGGAESTSEAVPSSSSSSLPTAQPLRQVQLSLVVEDGGDGYQSQLDSLPPFDNLAVESTEESKEAQPHIVFETVDLTPALEEGNEVDHDDKDLKISELDLSEKKTIKRENKFQSSTKEGFRPSKLGPPIDGELRSFFAGDNSVSQRGTTYYKQASHPVHSSFGVSVDFAGQHSDNPLYKPPVLPKKVFERGIPPSVSPYETTFADGPGYHKVFSSPGNFRKPKRTPSPVYTKHFTVNPFTASFKDSGIRSTTSLPPPPPPAYPDVSSIKENFLSPKGSSESHSQTILTVAPTPLPEPAPIETTPYPPLTLPALTNSIDGSDNKKLPHLKNDVPFLAPSSTFAASPPIPPPPPPSSSPYSDYGPASLLRLTPHGPSFPILSQISSDMENTFKGAFGLRGKNAHLYRNRLRGKKRPPPKEVGFRSRVGHMMNKLMGGHFGDRSFDVYDWLPLAAVLLGSALLLAGLFPNGFSSFGFNNGNIVLNNGRESRLDASPNDLDSSTALDVALHQLERGILLVGALREEKDGGGCAEKLACRLADLANDSFEDTEFVLDAINLVMPHHYNNFSRSLERVMLDGDRSACSKQCGRCISIQ